MVRSGVRAAAAVAPALLLLGCSGSSAAPTASTAASSIAAASSAPSGDTGFDRAVSVAVDGRKVVPSPGKVRIEVGERVRITVVSDVDNEVHVHGVDVEKELTADRPVTFVVAYDQPGIYEVEMHRPALLLFQFVVR